MQFFPIQLGLLRLIGGARRGVVEADTADLHPLDEGQRPHEEIEATAAEA